MPGNEDPGPEPGRAQRRQMYRARETQITNGKTWLLGGSYLFVQGFDPPVEVEPSLRLSMSLQAFVMSF